MRGMRNFAGKSGDRTSQVSQMRTGIADENAGSAGMRPAAESEEVEAPVLKKQGRRKVSMKSGSGSHSGNAGGGGDRPWNLVQQPVKKGG